MTKSCVDAPSSSDALKMNVYSVTKFITACSPKGKACIAPSFMCIQVVLGRSFPLESNRDNLRLLVVPMSGS